MSAVHPDALTYADAQRIVREAPVKDKSYRRFPIGQEVGRFLRAKRLEGCRPLTINAYESVLRRLTLRFPDFEGLEPFTERERGPELLLEFVDAEWGGADEHTRKQRFAVLGSFFEWAYRTDRLASDPMGKIKRPRVQKHGAARDRVPDAHISMMVSGQESVRDQAALLLLGRLALRREDLRMLQLRDIDLGRDELHLRHAKGGKEHTLPIAFKDVRDLLYLHMQERGGALTEGAGGVEGFVPQIPRLRAERPENGASGQEVGLTAPSVSARPWHSEEYLIYPKTSRTRPMSRAGIDLWFKRCMVRAGLVGYTMHQLRHAAIDEVIRQTGDWEIARQLARHENVQVTQGYVHRDNEWLRAKLGEMET